MGCLPAGGLQKEGDSMLAHIMRRTSSLKIALWDLGLQSTPNPKP